LDIVESLQDVESGVSTLMDENISEWNEDDDDPPIPDDVQEGAARLSYFLELVFEGGGSDCYVWGDQPYYYQDFQCEELSI